MSISSITQLAQSRAKLSRISSMHALLQRFVRDVETAPASKDLWIIKPDILIWSYNNESIGWMMEKDNLVRCQGSYDNTKGVWAKNTRSIAAKKIKSVSFELNIIENQIKEIKITFEIYLPEKQHKTFICKVGLRNGTLS